MKRFSRTLVLYIYLFTSIISIAGGSGIVTSSTVSFKPRGLDPKTHYFTSVKIPKHITPVSQSSFDIHDVCEIVDLSNIILFEETDYSEPTGNYTEPAVLYPSNKAPPRV